MKQFQCYAIGNRAYSLADIEGKFPNSVRAVCNLEIGQEVVDCDNDRWVRLPDKSEPGQLHVEHLPGEMVVYVPADRLERIATAVTEGMVNTIRTEDDYQRIRALAAARGMSVSQWIACDAVKQAHALIAELDKQA